MSTSPYSHAPSAYGSPPAPHMPQPHFYHAHDIDLGFPHNMNAQSNEEPSLIKHTVLPSKESDSRQGIILGFDGRLSIISTEQGKIQEVGGIHGFSGSVIDAVLLYSEVTNEVGPLIAVTIHGQVDIEHPPNDFLADHTNGLPQRQSDGIGFGYATRVDIFSLTNGALVASLLQSPAIPPMPMVRGASPTPPEPVGNLKLYASSGYLVIASGTSGEVFIFAAIENQPTFECIGKFWTTIQPLILRRESSHQRLPDTEISPADIGRGTKTSECAIVDVKGRWLAICPATLPSPPSIGFVIGPAVAIRRSNGLETTSAPTRPAVNCEVDSPDADTLFGKVARGVAQELVKGAKWLGDQGYQTWQSYWSKGHSPPVPAPQQPYSPPVYAQQLPTGFPPTHADATKTSIDPELISIFDLKAIQDSYTKRSPEEPRPTATFQPPSGCSFVSFSPHGLNLFTAGRKGDVQYIWDLMQIKHCRTSIIATDDDGTKAQNRVRQVARFERLSGSTIVDVAWDGLSGARIAILTRNRTIHLFDLPQSAFRWPAPRVPRKLQSPAVKPVDVSSGSGQQEPATTGGFFASALSIANRAQPIVTGWRGRAPSMSGGIAGIGSTGIGIASATGVRSSRVVAAGFSKSLGAASETVSSIRHAGDSRLHLKSDSVSGRLFWSKRGRSYILCVLDSNSLKTYNVRKSKLQDKPQRESSSVFDAKKATIIALPTSFDLKNELLALEGAQAGEAISGFWNPRPSRISKPLPHPLSFAEIETSAPYQPFHTDRRVTLSLYADHAQIGDGQQTISATSTQSRRRDKPSTPTSQWVFGNDIPVSYITLKKGPSLDEENVYSDSVIYRETTITSSTFGDNDMDQIVSTTRRSKKKKSTITRHDTTLDAHKDDFEFEDDCEVLDFASERV